jgi:hypothetical protein
VWRDPLKTLKYRPGFPNRFDSIEHAREFFLDQAVSPGLTGSPLVSTLPLSGTQGTAAAQTRGP